MILSEDKQKRKLGDFFDLLRVIENEIRITLTRIPVSVISNGKPTKMNVLQVLVDSTEPLDAILEKLEYTYTIDETHPKMEIYNESIRDFTMQKSDGNYYGRGYTLYKMPTVLPPGWIHYIFSGFNEVHIHIKPVPMDEALKKINNKETLYISNKSQKQDIKKKIRDIDILKKELQLGNTMIFEFTVNGFIFAETKPELLKAQKETSKVMNSLNARMTSSISQQRNIVNGGGASWMGDINSLAILYPFASSDMIETPNGVFLGTNKDTNSPIIYNPDYRKNHNIFTSGQPGSGKSFTNKILVKRFMEKRPDIMCHIIDPQGEYLLHADYFGLDSIELVPGKQYGLDPFSIFETKSEAVDIIGIVTHAPNETRKEWRSISDEISNINDLYEKSSADAKKYLVDLVKGPISEMFKGKIKFSDRMIISLKQTDGQEYDSLLILLTLVFSWKRVNSLPANTWKFILLDEAWRMTKIEESSVKIGDIARQGRKKSLILAVSTQQFSDLDKIMDGESRLTELFDTKIIMQMSQTASNSTGKALDLTDDEIERIINFKAGNGLLQTSDNTIYAKFEATKEETDNYFNTKEKKIE